VLPQAHPGENHLLMLHVPVENNLCGGFLILF
jgi:hypothetical protein